MSNVKRYTEERSIKMLKEIDAGRVSLRRQGPTASSINPSAAGGKSTRA